MEINRYPDGTSCVTAGNSNTTQVFRINDYRDIWTLKQFVDSYTNTYKSEPSILIPNLLDAQADRRFNEEESFGLKLILQELIRLDANIEIFHPHNPEVVEMAFEVMNKKVTIRDNTTFIKNVFREISTDELVLMSPDAGSFKPLMKLCDKIDWQGETHSASKARMSDGRMVQSLGREDFQGRDVLIVDDISVYGGTFKGLSKLLRDSNCGKIYLAVSHTTVENLGTDPVTNYFDKVFTTNSKFENFYRYSKGGGVSPDNLEVFKMF